MFNQLTKQMKATLYYLIALTLSVFIALFGQRLGQFITFVTMFTPMIAVLLMLLVVTGDGYRRQGWQELGLFRIGWQKWGLAIVAPILMMSCIYIMVSILGIGHLTLPSLNVSLISALWMPFLLNLFFDLAGSLGEEIGWRGYLVPHLLPQGRTRALLLSGFLQSLWHLPVMLLTPFYHSSGNRLIVVVLFVTTMTLAGVFFGYLRLSSESVWPSVLAHAAFNVVWGLFTAITVATTSSVILEYVAGESGILTLMGVGLIAFWLLNRLNREAPPQSVDPVDTVWATSR